MEERKSTYQYLPVSHTGFQDMDSKKSRTSQNPHSFRACCTRLRSGKCNVVLLIATAFILWVIIHVVNSGDHSESAELQEFQAEDKSARAWETLKSDKLESEESQNGQYDGLYEDETEDTTHGNSILEHTEDDIELDHYGSTESSVSRENGDANTDSANASMEDMIKQVIEDKYKVYDKGEEIYEDNENGKMTDNELTQDGLEDYKLEEDSSETGAEVDVSNDLQNNNSNNELLNIADTGKIFEEQSYKHNISETVNSTGGGNKNQLQLLDNKTSNSFKLTDDIYSLKEPVSLQEEKSLNFDKKTAEDILHVSSWQSNNTINQQSLNTDAKLAKSNIENTNDSLVPNRINFAESFHKIVGPESDSIKLIQNSRETGYNLPDSKNDQTLTFINNFKGNNDITDRISNKNTADEIILSEQKDANDLNPGEKAVLHENYPSENKDTQRKRRSLVHVLKVPLRQKKK